MKTLRLAAVASLLAAAFCNSAFAKEPTAKQKALFAKFEKLMTNVKLVGKYTIVGKPVDKLPTEEYTIVSAKKLKAGDKWLLQARIKFATYDLTVPLQLDIKWAGDTPMITLTDFTIPGLGTFSARVLFNKNKYAGTWTHGKVGGHMFGVLKAGKKAAKKAAKKTKK